MEEARKFSFSKGRVALFWGGQKIFIFEGAFLINGGGGDFLEGYLSPYYNTGRGNQVLGEGGVHSSVVGSILL